VIQPKIVEVRGDVHVRDIFTCEVCGARELGDWRRVTVVCVGSEVPESALGHARSADMPVGWSGGDAWKCETCCRQRPAT
jgi:hypothetical protein